MKDEMTIEQELISIERMLWTNTTPTASRARSTPIDDRPQCDGAADLSHYGTAKRGAGRAVTPAWSCPQLAAPCRGAVRAGTQARLL